MKGPDVLAEHSGVLRTRMGACWPGTRAVFRGHDLHSELGGMGWVELYLFGITGRRFSPAQIRLVEALWTHTSYPDARLWNNRIAALSGSARSSANLGVCAALAASEATVYGGGAGIRAMGFLVRTVKAIEAGGDRMALILAEIRQRRIYGYGRPINSEDERIPWLTALAKQLGLADGPHLALAIEVEGILVARNAALKMNYAAVHAALLADMGISIREYQLLRIPTFLAGMPPCQIEATEKPEGALFPLRCEDVVYEGAERRTWHPGQRCKCTGSYER
jgi:hypothetical protein